MLRGYSFASIFYDDLVPFWFCALACQHFRLGPSLRILARAVFKFHYHCAVLAVELDRILDQVREHLLEPPRISEDHCVASDSIAHDYSACGSLCCQRCDD